MARYLGRSMNFEDIQHLKCLPGEFPFCELCGQRPDSITFSLVDCKSGCPMHVELAESAEIAVPHER